MLSRLRKGFGDRMNLIPPGISGILAAIALSTTMTAGTANAAPNEGVYVGRVPISTWEALAGCESTWRWHINSGNGYYGGLQFSDQTWDGFGGEQFAPFAHQTGKYNQMTVAQRVKDAQGWGAWPTCTRKIGIRR